MIIPRQKTFSKIRIKLFGENSEKTKALVGGGLAIGGTELAIKVNDKLRNKLHKDEITDSELAKENKRLHKKLERVAKKQRTAVTTGDSSYYDRTKPELKKGALKAPCSYRFVFFFFKKRKPTRPKTANAPKPYQMALSCFTSIFTSFAGKA